MTMTRASWQWLARVAAACAVLSAYPSIRLSAQIADNSFLLEEAYNQESRVVQHINAFLRSESGSWLYTFTQEWPAWGQRNQFSYTLPLLDGAQGDARFGDVLLNYRYQLVGVEGPVSVSPRVSAILPTGSANDGTGDNTLGVQFNLPVSVTVGSQLVTHWNAGYTVLPNAQLPGGSRRTITATNLGGSAIWLVTSKFNVMLESLWVSDEGVEEWFVVPGVRWAHDFTNGLQVVPGFAYVAGVGPSSGDSGFFLYLSLEHGF